MEWEEKEEEAKWVRRREKPIGRGRRRRKVEGDDEERENLLI